MANLVRPTEAYVEAEIFTTAGGISGAKPTGNLHRFELDGEKVYLPQLGSNPRGVRHYMTYNELCELVTAYEKYAGIVE